MCLASFRSRRIAKSGAVGLDLAIQAEQRQDFGELVFRGGFEHHGVLLLRLQDERPNHRAQVVASVLKEHAERLVGNFAVATEKSFRIRAKP